MPTISESELSQDEPEACFVCGEFEGAIWLCGEGLICESDFAKLAEIDEESLFIEDRLLLDFEVPKEYTARAKAKLMNQKRKSK